MNIEFKKNCPAYISAVKENENLNSNKKILYRVERALQFKYGNVTRQKFEEKYSAEDWFGRKVIALPATIWSGVVKAIYHLAKAILIGIPKAPDNNRYYLKAQAFNVARDFQESYGELTSFFNDRYGQFHVQESKFQKICYDYFTAFTEVKKISLSDYKEKTVQKRNKLLQRFDLNRIRDISLDDFVDQADADELKIFTLEDVIIPFKISKLKFASLNKEKFNALTIKDLQEDINEDQCSFIRQRLEKISKNAENGNEQKTIDDYSNFNEIPLRDLAKISASNIDQHKEKIPAIAFAFFTNNQIQKLKLSEMQTSQNKFLFTKERLALFSDQDIVSAVEAQALKTTCQLKLLSDKQLKSIQVSKLSKEIIEDMFPQSQDDTANRRRFANFEVAEVQTALNLRLITSTYLLNLLSDQQLKGIQVSKLSKEIIEDMFPQSQDDTANRRRFANFEVAEVQTALNLRLITSTYLLNLLSDQQLKGIQLSKLSKEIIEDMFPQSQGNTANRRRFANFEVGEVRAALNSGLMTNLYLPRLLSDEQLEGVQLSKLPKEVIEDMFGTGNYMYDWICGYGGYAYDRRRFANFKAAEVQAALANNKFIKYLVSLISIEQLEGFDFSTASQKVINMLFPLCSVGALRKEYSYYSYSEKKLQEMSKNQELKNKTLFEQLSLKQQQDLKPRLYQAENSSPQSDTYSNFNDFCSKLNGFCSKLNDFCSNSRPGAFGSNFTGFHFNFEKAIPTTREIDLITLGLQPTASGKEIGKKFRELALIYHSDKFSPKSNESDSDCKSRKENDNKKFQEISAAYNRLTKGSERV